jgi:hypothetical protein
MYLIIYKVLNVYRLRIFAASTAFTVTAFFSKSQSGFSGAFQVSMNALFFSTFWLGQFMSSLDCYAIPLIAFVVWSRVPFRNVLCGFLCASMPPLLVNSISWAFASSSSDAAIWMRWIQALTFQSAIYLIFMSVLQIIAQPQDEMAPPSPSPDQHHKQYDSNPVDAEESYWYSAVPTPAGVLWHLAVLLETCVLSGLKRRVDRNLVARLMAVGCASPAILKAIHWNCKHHLKISLPLGLLDVAGGGHQNEVRSCFPIISTVITTEE